MFAFTLWDEEQQALYLARDPLGIKPLYYSANTTAVSVASQAKALLASRQVSAAGSDAGLAGFLLLGSVPEPLTAWSSIESVEAGTFVRIERGGTQATHRYYSLPGVLAGGAVGTAKADLSEAFRDSVAAHLVADVEVGLFLSAGIDSASLLGLAAALGHKTRAVTLGFSEYAGDERDETPVAADAAKFYGASHTVRWVSQVEMLESVPEVLADMDQPSVDGLNTWLVARATAEQGLKVALSGIGGDELLGGYSTFRTVPSTMRLLRQVPGRARLGPVFRRLSAPLVSGRSPKLPGVLEYGGSFAENWFLHRAVFMPWDLPDLLGQERARSALSTLDLPGLLTKALTPRPPSDMAAVSALETALYMRNQLLRDADWAGMAHSLEIRVPLSDSWLVQSMAGPLSQEWGPRDGKQALGAAPTPPLPGSVVDRPKSGFAVPVGEWVVSDPNYSSWRRNRVLIPERCPWARRWAYVVADRFGLL